MLDFICMFTSGLFRTEREVKIQNEYNISSEIQTHSTPGKSALKTARPRRLDDDLWCFILQDSGHGIQINKIITDQHVSN